MADEEDLRAAIFKYYTEQVSYEKIEEEFGIPTTTFRHHFKKWVNDPQNMTEVQERGPEDIRIRG